MRASRAHFAVTALLVAITTLLWWLYGEGSANVDAQYATLWGHQLLHGERVEIDAPWAPTPHPLTVLTGAVVALIGGGSVASMAIFNHLTVAAALLALFLLAAELLDRRTGVVAIALLLFAPLPVMWMLFGPNDALWLGGLLLAARNALRAPDRPAGVLWPLGVIGLLRPEAWALAGLYCVYLWSDPARRRAVYALAFTLPPVLWLGFEWVLTGDPLSSWRGTRELVGALERPTGGLTALTELPTLVEDAVGILIPMVAVFGAVAVVQARGRTGAAFLVGGGALVAMFVVLGLAGFSVIGRYLLPVDFALVVLAAAGLTAWADPRLAKWRRPAGVLATLATFAFGVGLNDAVQRQRNLRDAMHASARTWHDLRSVISPQEARRSCGPVDLSGPYMHRPLLALHLDTSLTRLRDSTLAEPVRGLHILPGNGWVRADVRAPSFVRREARPVPGARLVRRNRSWQLWEHCPPAPSRRATVVSRAAPPAGAGARG